MTTFTLVVELFVSGAWLDITRIDDETKVLRDGSLTITRGRSDQQGQVAPTEVRFEYQDNNALLDGDNYASPYFRLIGLGTPMRVTIDGDVRAVVEIVSWEPSWDEIDRVVKVSVLGAGILRRLGDGQKPLRSAAYRTLTSSTVDSERIMYWPVEEEFGATDVFSPYSSLKNVGIRDIQFGAYTESPASARMATFGTTGQLYFPPPTYTSTEHKVVSLWTLPETSLPSGTLMMRLYCTGGNIDHIDLEYGASLDGSLRLNAYSGTGVLIDTANFVDWSSYIVDQHFALSLEFTQNGADLDNTVFVVPQDETTNGASFNDTLTAVTIGRIWAVVAAETSCEGASFGHLAIGNDTGAFANFLSPVSGNALAVRGYTNEFAGERIERLADEGGLPITVTGTTSEPVGPQVPGTAADNVLDAVDTDMGLLFEPRTVLELEYRTRASLHNQVPAATLTYAHLSKGFRPAADDLRVTNAVTTQRDRGGTAHYAIPDDDWWHWTTQDPPDGAGLRESEATPNVADDDQLSGQAAWLAHLGSWREKRFRRVPLELARGVFDAADRAAVRALDLGDVLAIDTTGSPPYVPYDEIRLTVQGYTETVTRHTHTFTFTTTPADVYEVEVTDTGGSTSVVAIDDNDTSLKLATSLGREWSTADEPYHIQVAGQPMTVTTMVTDTPAFINAGTVSHANNAAVTPGLPAGITPDVGQLLLAWVAIRSSGAGTVDEHGTWTTLFGVAGQNVKLFARYYVTGDAAPSFGFSGGSAGDDTSARIFAFSGLSKEFASGTKAVPAGSIQLNSSAQDVGYPALKVNRDGSVALIFLWKQDDATGYAPPSGFTEMADNSTTTGNDQSIAAYYDLTAVSAAAGSAVVTGGASAISRGLVLALRPLQTATVTRGIAGTATSAAAGSEVHVWRPGVNGL